MFDIAIIYLQEQMKLLENNEPINRSAGNIAQADLEKSEISNIKKAIAVLDAIGAAAE